MILPSLYRELAPWWPLFSHPDDYRNEARWYGHILNTHGNEPSRTLLELGSGGGNNASHLKRHFQCTLVDLSPDMLEVSRALNPTLEHVQGNMRTIRLERQFDRVFIHDAISYLTTAEALREAIQTAWVHLRPGGSALFAPDNVQDTFESFTDTGGHDGEGRSVRFLEWQWDPDPADSTYQLELAILLREHGQPMRSVHESHTHGLFSRQTWLDILTEAGFQATVLPYTSDGDDYEAFCGVRPLGG